MSKNKKRRIEMLSTCVNCNVQMHTQKMGAYVVKMFQDPPVPYQIYAGYIHQCRMCQNEVVGGWSEKPIAEHFQLDFNEVLQTIMNSETAVVVYEYERIDHAYEANKKTGKPELSHVLQLFEMQNQAKALYKEIDKRVARMKNEFGEGRFDYDLDVLSEKYSVATLIEENGRFLKFEITDNVRVLSEGGDVWKSVGFKPVVCEIRSLKRRPKSLKLDSIPNDDA